MDQEKIKVLQLLEDGKISSAEAVELLNTLESAGEKQGTAPGISQSDQRALRVRVDGDKTKVNVNIPMSLLRVASQIGMLGMQWLPAETNEQMKKQGIDLAKIDFAELMRLLDEGLSDGKLVDIETEDEKEGKTKVAVYVE